MFGPSKIGSFLACSRPSLKSQIIVENKFSCFSIFHPNFPPFSFHGKKSSFRIRPHSDFPMVFSLASRCDLETRQTIR